MKIYIIPLASVIILIAAFLFVEPTITGQVVFSDQKQVIDADVHLRTSPGEIIPLSAIVTVGLDEQRADMSVRRFLALSGQGAVIDQGTLPGTDRELRGLAGARNYTVPLNAFDLEREVEPGAHRLTTTITFAAQTLYEQESWVVVT